MKKCEHGYEALCMRCRVASSGRYAWETGVGINRCPHPDGSWEALQWAAEWKAADDAWEAKWQGALRRAKEREKHASPVKVVRRPAWMELQVGDLFDG